uniref:Uncharacterized protein n=1 Tax=Quercus lobata TaxID=97700 RepID=A0A7N2L8M8_QUELO
MLSLILLVTHFAMKEKFHVEFLGWIYVAISISVFVAPLSIVVSNIIKAFELKSVEFMPFNLSFFLTLNVVMWFAYGLFLKDICIAINSKYHGFCIGATLDAAICNLQKQQEGYTGK